MINDELMKELEKAHVEIGDLRKRIERLERSGSLSQLPNTMILSPTFLKRAFAVYGHALVAGFLIAIPFYCVIAVLTLLGN